MIFKINRLNGLSYEHWGLGIRYRDPFVKHLRYNFYPYYMDTEALFLENIRST